MLTDDHDAPLFVDVATDIPVKLPPPTATSDEVDDGVENTRIEMSEAEFNIVRDENDQRPYPESPDMCREPPIDCTDAMLPV